MITGETFLILETGPSFCKVQIPFLCFPDIFEEWEDRTINNPSCIVFSSTYNLKRGFQYNKVPSTQSNSARKHKRDVLSFMEFNLQRPCLWKVKYRTRSSGHPQMCAPRAQVVNLSKSQQPDRVHEHYSIVCALWSNVSLLQYQLLGSREVK